jgi:hypothetical protein
LAGKKCPFFAVRAKKIQWRERRAMLSREVCGDRTIPDLVATNLKAHVNRRFIRGILCISATRGKRIMETSSVEITDLLRLPGHQDRSFQSLLAAIEKSPIEVADLSATALRDVLKGVITGEGPTIAGRAHFSRTLDPGDVSLCARILTAAGGEAGAPVTRLEANVLFDIDAAAAERTDGGRFDDLLVKSVAHFALAEAGHMVPPRQVALDPATELSSWANRSTDIDGEILAWIASQVRNKKRLKSTLMGFSAFLTGIGATLSVAAPSITAVADLIV